MSVVQKKITIADIAKELGVSKTTVSRSISGKGRIGEKTKQMVLDYIDKNGYTPNVVARGLAVSKTYNIAVVMPKDRSLIDIPFFHECLNGIVRKAEENFYDIIICMVQKEDISQLKRIVSNQKVDGVILMRPLEQDPMVEYLQQEKVPFLVIGKKEGTIQVDNAHEEACQALTSLVIAKGKRRIGLIGAGLEQCVTKQRYQGYCEALKQWKLPIQEELVCLGAVNDKDIERFTRKLLQLDVDCIIGMDDYFCRIIYQCIKKEQSNKEESIMIASFYDHEFPGEDAPYSLSIHCNVEEIGITSARTMIELIEEKIVPDRTVLGYEIIAK